MTTRFLGFELTSFSEKRWLSGKDAIEEVGGIFTVFEPDPRDNYPGWKVALDYGENLRLLVFALTLFEAEESMRIKLRAVSRWSLRIAEGKVPPPDEPADEPIEAEIVEVDGFRIGDLVRFFDRDSRMGDPDVWCAVNALTDGQIWYTHDGCAQSYSASSLVRKPVEIGDNVRFAHIPAGRVLTIQRDVLGVEWVWFANDTCIRLFDVIAVESKEPT